MTIFVALVSAAARTANGKKINSSVAPEFFSCVPEGRAQRVPVRLLQHGQHDKSSSGMVECNEDERSVAFGNGKESDCLCVTNFSKVSRRGILGDEWFHACNPANESVRAAAKILGILKIACEFNSVRVSAMVE